MVLFDFQKKPMCVSLELADIVFDFVSEYLLDPFIKRCSQDLGGKWNDYSYLRGSMIEIDPVGL